MIYDSFISDVRFTDTLNFPDGIQKNQYFTQMEADVLTRCGHKMMQLFEGTIEAENDDQVRFLAAVKGKIKPLYHLEYVFLKYLALVNQQNKLTA